MRVRSQRQLRLAASASRRLGLCAHATFSGALLWPMVYPWPPRPSGLVEEGFAELARSWRPILDAFDETGVDLCFEIHPGEDLHDGATFERFLDAVWGGGARTGEHAVRSQICSGNKWTIWCFSTSIMSASPWCM